MLPCVFSSLPVRVSEVALTWLYGRGVFHEPVVRVGVVDERAETAAHLGMVVVEPLHLVGREQAMFGDMA